MIQGEEHTGSYYAATRNDHTTYASLEGEHETDVCIIGGGFTGVACALTLAERGTALPCLNRTASDGARPVETVVS